MSVLYIVATPIGNLEDMTLRALRVLKEVDVLACEDTRHTRRLLEHFEIPRPETVISYHEHNEDRGAEKILDIIESGKTVALCSDAGYPGVSDPGYVVISRAVERGIKVEVIPGAGAVEVALLMSGLPTSSYTFRGFPPRKSGKRQTFIGQDKDRPHTQIFYESPFRIGKFLKDAYTVLGDRKAAVCLELTKKFERGESGWLSDLAEKFLSGKTKGEIVVVIAGNNPKFLRTDTDEEAND